MRVSAGIAVNAVTGWISILLNAAIGLAIVPFLIAQLGAAGYGLTALAGTIVTFCMLIDLGLAHALSRQLSESVAAENSARISEYCSTAFATYFGFSLLLLLGLFIFGTAIVSILNVPEQFTPDASFLIHLYAPAMVSMTLWGSIHVSVLQAHSRFDTINIINTNVSLLRGGSMFAVLILTAPSIYAWAWVMLAGQLLRVLLLSRRSHKLEANLGIRLSSVRSSIFKGILSLGGAVFLIRVTSTLTNQSDSIVLSAFLGPVAVAIYYPAIQIGLLTGPLVSMVVNQLHPLVTSFFVKGDTDSIKNVIVRSTKYTLLMGVFVTAFTFIFAEPICRIWLQQSLGDDYRETAVVLAAISVVDLLSYASGAHWPVLLGMKRLKFLIWAQMSTSVIALAIAIFLVGYARMGIAGVLIPAVGSALVLKPLIMLYVYRVCGLKKRAHVKSSFLGPSLVMIGLLLVNSIVLIGFRPDSVLSLGVALCISAIAWGVLAWFVGLSGQDRKSFAHLTRQLIQRLGVG